MNENHLTQSQVAKRWTVCESTLQKWRRMGIGPVYLKLVNRVVYRLSDIQSYEQKNLCISTSRKAPWGAHEDDNA